MGTLSIVATPIGNLEDITLRALRTLKECDVIYAEDTRVISKLLARYEIQKPLQRLDAATEIKKADEIIARLERGESVALVSDAGTPGISDPGAMLISQIKERFGHLNNSAIAESFKGQVEVIPIPGASALIAALSASGLPTHEFIYLGFLPHKKGRETLFKEMQESKRTVVFYESPHRILKTLESLIKFCPNKKVCLARKITKIYEEFKTGSPAELLEYLTKNPIHQKGEFTVLVV